MGCFTSSSNSQYVFIVNDCSINENVLKENTSKEENNINNLLFPSNKEKTSTCSNASSILSSHCTFQSMEMLKALNKARTNPEILIPRIEKLKKYIIRIKNSFFLSISLGEFTDDIIENDNVINNNINNLSDNDKVNIKLSIGEESFDNCIEYLKYLSLKKNKLHPLIMKEDLKIPFPMNSPNSCISRDYLKNVILFKTQEVGKKINIIDFHYDICIENPEFSILMQIVDDTNDNYQRRFNIFNQQAKFVGISEGKISKNMACYYLMFGK